MDQPNPNTIDSKPPREKWWLRWWMVFVWLAIFGPFAIFTVWKSRDFNLFWKWAITLVTLVATIALFWAAWEMIVLFMQELREAGLY